MTISIIYSTFLLVDRTSNDNIHRVLVQEMIEHQNRTDEFLIDNASSPIILITTRFLTDEREIWREKFSICLFFHVTATTSFTMKMFKFSIFNTDRIYPISESNQVWHLIQGDILKNNGSTSFAVRWSVISVRLFYFHQFLVPIIAVQWLKVQEIKPCDYVDDVHKELDDRIDQSFVSSLKSETRMRSVLFYDVNQLTD